MGILMVELLMSLIGCGIFAVLFFTIIFISKRVTSGGIINSKYTIFTMCKEIKGVLSALK